METAWESTVTLEVGLAFGKDSRKSVPDPGETWNTQVILLTQ